MDYLSDQTTINLSSESDEGESRAQKTVTAVIGKLTEPQARLLRRVKDTFRIPDSLIGILTVIKELAIDLRQLNKDVFHVNESIQLFIDLYKAIENITGTSAEIDRGQAWSLNINEVRMMVRKFNQDYSLQDQQKVRALRGVCVYFSLCKSPGLSIDLQAHITNLINGRPGYQSLIDQSLDQLLDYAVDENSEIEPFLNTLKKYLATDGLSLNEVIRTAVQIDLPVYSHVPQQVEVDAGSSDDENEGDLAEAAEEPTKSWDHISFKKYVQQYQGFREKAGIIEPFKYLKPYELEVIIPTLIQDLNSGMGRRSAGACLLTFFLSSTPKIFHLIGFQCSDIYSSWLDLERNCFVWDLNRITKIKNHDITSTSHIRIPLPLELGEFLKELHLESPDAQNLAELFGGCDALAKSCRQYLRAKSLTSHRPTLTRLSESFGRYIATLIDDETYASAIGIDFNLGVTSNFNYTVIKGSKLAAILTEVYEKLGFKPFILPKLDDVAAPNDIDTKNVEDLVNHLTKRVDAIFAKLATNVRFDNLCSFHNELAESMACLVATCSGHRSADEYGFFAHTIDTATKICLISDKRVNDYQWGRIVPLATLVSDYLDLYLNWLESLSNRLSGMNRPLSVTVNSVLRSSPEAPYPLFFRIDAKKVTWLGTRHIQHLFDEHKLPANCGRDYLDFVLKKHGADSCITMMIEGHAAFGQEQISLASLVKLSSVIKTARECLDRELDQFVDADRIRFKPRAHKSDDVNTFNRKGKATLAAEYKPQDQLAPQCPFNVRFIQNLSGVEKHLKDWRNANGPLKIEDLYHALILVDGVACEAELREVARILLDAGTIHVIDGRFFVDTVTPDLGYRRLWVSYATIFIAINLPKDTRCPSLDKTTLKLIEIVQAHYIFHAPAMLGLWAGGKFSARCSRPQTLARHHFNWPEIPVVQEGVSNKIIHFDDRLILIAIGQATDTSKNAGARTTRVKRLADCMDQFLENEIEDMAVLILAKYVRYLCDPDLDLGPSTISRYYSAIKPFVDIFAYEIDNFEQLATVDWVQVVDEWKESEEIRPSENSPEITAVNHFLDFVESNTKIKRNQKKLSCPVLVPADYPSVAEIAKAYNLIQQDQSLSEALRLESLVFLGLMSQKTLRPSEVRALRIIDVYFGLICHVVVTSEAIGTVKSINANRVLVIDDDEFDTLSMLKKLYDIKSNSRTPESYLFAHEDGLNLQRADEILIVIRNALYEATGYRIKLHSFRQFNITRDVALSANKSGDRALADRTALAKISVLSGHGYPLTTHENYGCEYDQLRRAFWSAHKVSIRIQAPIIELKQRLGCTFPGNLPTNQPSFDLLMGLCMQNPDFHSRIKDCRDYVQPFKSAEPVSLTSSVSCFADACQYVFHLCIGAKSEDALVESRVDSQTKQLLDQGISISGGSFFKSFSAENLRNFRNTFFQNDFKDRANLFRTFPIYQPQAMMLLQLLPVNLCETIYISNIAQLSFFEEQANLFNLGGVEIFISINTNTLVENRKALRQKPFSKLPEQAFSKSILCELSFWMKGLSMTKRPRNLSLVQQEINLILLTKSLTIIGAKNEL
jgi:integrase